RFRGAFAAAPSRARSRRPLRPRAHRAEQRRDALSRRRAGRPAPPPGPRRSARQRLLDAIPGSSISRQEVSRGVEARVLEGDGAEIRAERQEASKQEQLLVEDAAMVGVDEAVLDDFASREVDLEAVSERQPIEVVEERGAATATPPLPREQ